MDSLPPTYRCRACGASSYRRLVQRAADGAMRYSDVFRCSGCSLDFTELGAWRERRLRPRGSSMRAPRGDDDGSGAPDALAGAPR